MVKTGNLIRANLVHNHPKMSCCEQDVHKFKVTLKKDVIGNINVNEKEYPSLHKFMQYLINNYFETNCFPVAVWNHFSTEGNRTNNNVEGYNNRLKNFVGAASPNIYKAAEIFQQEEVQSAIKYAKANSLNGRISKPQLRKHLDIKKETQ